MSSDSEVSGSDQEVDDVTPEEKEQIRKEVSNMSFEEIIKLKGELGAKLYTKAINGDSPNKEAPRSFKRVNKNRPREMSSKIKPRLVKKAPTEYQHHQHQQKQRVIDPRFNERYGEFDKESFKANYKFIDDMRKDERKQLLKELETTENPQRKKQIKILIQRMDNQFKESEKAEKQQVQQNVEREQRKQMVKDGKKPLFKSKSAKKIEDLINKYEDLKKSNKLQKHMERRSKKMLNKERKKLSYVHV